MGEWNSPGKFGIGEPVERTDSAMLGGRVFNAGQPGIGDPADPMARIIGLMERMLESVDRVTYGDVTTQRISGLEAGKRYKVDPNPPGGIQEVPDTHIFVEQVDEEISADRNFVVDYLAEMLMLKEYPGDKRMWTGVTETTRNAWRARADGVLYGYALRHAVTSAEQRQQVLLMASHAVDAWVQATKIIDDDYLKNIRVMVGTAVSAILKHYDIIPKGSQ